MKRYILATILLLLAIEMIAAVVVLYSPAGPNVLSMLSAVNPTPTPTAMPVLSAAGGTPPTVNATSAYLLDQDTGNTLANVNGEQRLPMASTTKIMTALIAIETADLNQVVTVKQDAVDETKNNASTAGLVVGDQLRLKDLLYALMLPSGDDAAIAIADTISGTPAEFVKKMNTYAQKLHLKNTHFINPDGLTYTTPDGKLDPNNVNHYTTAADLAHLTRIALQNPLFGQIVQLQHYTLPATSVHHSYTTWDTTNDLLGLYPGTTGVKTGFTEEAGPCLVFAATNAGHHLIGILLKEKDPDPDKGKQQRFADAKALLDWGFALPLKSPSAS